MFHEKSGSRLAFSLTEVLVTMLVVSLVMAAMAPVMTKKHRETIGTLEAVEKPTGAVLEPTAIVEVMGDALNFVEKVSSGVFKFTNSTDKDIIIKRLTLQGAGGGGGGFHRSGDITFYLKDQVSINGKGTGWLINRITTTPTTDYFQYGWQIPVGVSNVRIALLGGGGGGGAANGAQSSKNFNGEAYVAPGMAEGGKELCILKYNIGDIPSLGGNIDNSSGAVPTGGIPSGVNMVKAVASGASADTGTTNTCWYGTTAPTGGSYPCTKAGVTIAGASTPTTYSGCYRTLCTWDVANKACGNLGWRLPTDAEIKRWREDPGANSAYKSKGVVVQAASDFCDYTSSLYGSSMCYYLAGGCPGSSDSNCNTYVWWSAAAPVDYYLNGGTLYGPYSNYAGRPFSARCVSVRSNGTCGFITYHGAGGSGGAGYSSAVFNNLTPYDSATGKGDRLLFTIGAGGAGATSTGVSGTDGGQTCVEHQTTTNGGTTWTKVPNTTTYCAYGGKGGGGASTSANGAKAAATTCSLGTGCSNGSQGSDWTSNSSTNGGASPTVVSGIGGAGAQGYDSSTGNGNSATTYWGSGGAGGMGFDASSYGKGGNGAAGWARVMYQVTGIGSGGGAGGYWHSQTITVEPGKSLKITVGYGGAGGASIAGGINGQDTFVELEGNELFRALGGKGGGYTPVVSNYVSTTMAKGGAGGGLQKNKTDASNPTHITDASGKDAAWAMGGNGGISINEARPSSAALGGCANAPFGNLSFSACNNGMYMPGSVFKNVYYITTGSGAGGGGGGGSSCDESNCASGGKGSDGFVIISW